jgi:hypothetical protein
MADDSLPSIETSADTRPIWLRRLFRRQAIPPWIVVAVVSSYQILDVASNTEFAYQKWAAMKPYVLPIVQFLETPWGSLAVIVLGFVWLGWIASRPLPSAAMSKVASGRESTAAPDYNRVEQPRRRGGLFHRLAISHAETEAEVQDILAGHPHEAESSRTQPVGQRRSKGNVPSLSAEKAKRRYRWDSTVERSFNPQVGGARSPKYGEIVDLDEVIGQTTTGRDVSLREAIGDDWANYVTEIVDGPDPESCRRELPVSVETRSFGVALIASNATPHVVKQTKVTVTDASFFDPAHNALVPTATTHQGKDATFRPLFVDPNETGYLFPAAKRAFGLTAMHDNRLTITGHPIDSPKADLKVTLLRKGEWHVTVQIDHDGKTRPEVVRFLWDGKQVTNATLSHEDK